MKVTPLSQLRVEDFPKEQQMWLSLLFTPLNQFLTVLTTALQENLDFDNNTLGQENNLSFTWSSQTASLPIKFQLTMNGSPKELQLCQATENKTPVILILTWQVVSGAVQITDIAKVASGVISQLVSGAAYTLRVRLQT